MRSRSRKKYVRTRGSTPAPVAIALRVNGLIEGALQHKFLLFGWIVILALALFDSATVKGLVVEGYTATVTNKGHRWHFVGVVALFSVSLLSFLIGFDRVVSRRTALLGKIKTLKRQVEFHRSELDTIKEGFPIGLFLVSAQNLVRFANAQYLSFTGLSPAEQNRKSWTDSVWPEDRQSVTLRWQEAFDAHLTFEDLVRLDCKGACRWVRVRLVPIHTNGDVLGYVGVGIDENSHVENEEILRRQLNRIEDMQSKLDQTVELLQRFILEERSPPLTCPPNQQTHVLESSILLSPLFSDETPRSQIIPPVELPVEPERTKADTQEQRQHPTPQSGFAADSPRRSLLQGVLNRLATL